MAVVNVHLKWSGRDGDQESTSGRRYRETYSVLTDAPTTTAAEVAAAAGVPPFGAGFTGDGFSLLTRKTPRCVAPLLWELDAIYEPAGGGGSDPNPLNEPPVIRWTGAKSTEPVDFAYNANNEPVIPILNSAREPFENPVTRQVDDSLLTVTRNKNFFNPGTARQYRNAINNDTFVIGPSGETCPPGAAMMVQFDADYITVENPLYNHWRHTYGILIREGVPATNNGPQGASVGGTARAWFARRLDEGLREWFETEVSTGLPRYRTIRDVNGDPVTRPSLLDGLGGRLPGADDPVIMEWRTQKLLPFAGLGIL